MRKYILIIIIFSLCLVFTNIGIAQEQTKETTKTEQVAPKETPQPVKAATTETKPAVAQKKDVPLGEISSIDLTKQNAEKYRLAIGLKDTIVLTLANNLDIKIEKLNERISDADINVQKGFTYDALFQATITKADEENKTPSAVYEIPGFGLFGSNVSKTNTTSLDTSIIQKIPTGAVLTLDYYDQRIKSNSSQIDPKLVPYYDMGTTLSINQPLLRNFGPFVTNAQINIAKNNSKISKEVFRERVINQIAEITSLYWELYFARENLKLKEVSLEQAKNLLYVNRAKVKQGVLPPTYEIQAEADVAAREMGLIEAEALIKDMEDRIKKSTNLSQNKGVWDFELYPIDLPTTAPITVDLEGCISTVLEKNPTLIQVQTNFLNKKIQERVAKNQRLPQLDLFGSVGVMGLNESNSEAFDNMYGNDYDNWAVGLTFSYPIQNRAARYRYKQAVLDREKTETIIENINNDLILQTRIYARQIESNLKQIYAGEKDVISQERKLDAEQKRYDVGLSTSQDILNYQRDLETARSGKVRAIVDYNISQIKLEALKGTLLEKNGINLE